MASFWYNQGVDSDNLDWNNDTLKVLLVKSGSTLNKDHDTVAAVVAGSGSSAADEADATNYARGTLAGKSTTVDDTGDTTDYDATDQTFTSLGGASNNTLIGAVIYKEVTNDSDSVPLLYIEFSSATATDGNNYVVQWGSPLADIAT